MLTDLYPRLTQPKMDSREAKADGMILNTHCDISKAFAAWSLPCMRCLSQPSTWKMLPPLTCCPPSKKIQKTHCTGWTAPSVTPLLRYWTHTTTSRADWSEDKHISPICPKARKVILNSLPSGLSNVFISVPEKIHTQGNDSIRLISL